MKKVNKPRKKDTKRIGDKKKRVLADVLLTEGLQQDSQQVEETPIGRKQQTTTAARSRVVTARNLALLKRGVLTRCVSG